MKIVLCNIRPPIPTRDHDWIAYVDGDEERQEYGYGRTGLDALVDWYVNHSGVDDEERSPIVQALRRALAVMDEPVADWVAPSARADILDEQMHRIEGDIKAALKGLALSARLTGSNTNG